MKPTQDLEELIQIMFFVPSAPKKLTRDLTSKLQQHATINTAKLDVTYTVMVWQLANIDTPKLWREKLDGPSLYTEMEKQKSLHTFKHHTSTSYTVTQVERELVSGKSCSLYGETSQACYAAHVYHCFE